MRKPGGRVSNEVSRRESWGRAHSRPIRILLRAIKQGRPIVPFLAAGISVNSGFPSLAATTSYLAKVRYYINQVFENPYTSDGANRGGTAAYLRQYGWPDMNRLNADVWRHAVRIDGRAQRVSNGAAQVTPSAAGESDHLAQRECCRSLVERTVREQGLSGRNALLNQIFSLLKMLRINLASRQSGDRARVERILEKAISRWEHENLRLQQIVDLQHLEMLYELDGELTKSIIENMWISGEGNARHLRGDWYGLLMSLSEGDFDIIDDLFVSLAHGRHPTAAHTFLAQLVDVLRVRLFLTINFDPFIETALREEGHSPAVYEVFRDGDLPSPLVVRRQLAVLKLHGGSYGVRIGERIQESLDEGTRRRALELIPRCAHPCSGLLGRRAPDDAVARERRAYRTGEQSKNTLDALGRYPDEPVDALRRRLEGAKLDRSLVTARLQDAGSFLFEFLCALTGDFPSTRRSYRALPTRPTANDPRVAADRAASEIAVPWSALAPSRIHIFSSYSFWNEESETPNEPTCGGGASSLEMSRFCSQLEAHQYHTIWIDCEEHHTTEGLVADILDQINVVDPSFTPLLLQTSEPRAELSIGPEQTHGVRRGQHLRLSSASAKRSSAGVMSCASTRRRRSGDPRQFIMAFRH